MGRARRRTRSREASCRRPRGRRRRCLSSCPRSGRNSNLSRRRRRARPGAPLGTRGRAGLTSGVSSTGQRSRRRRGSDGVVWRAGACGAVWSFLAANVHSSAALSRSGIGVDVLIGARKIPMSRSVQASGIVVRCPLECGRPSLLLLPFVVYFSPILFRSFFPSLSFSFLSFSCSCHHC